ncbi:sensor histidine kinase [Tenacibaculum retecalamus]|uniref:sensor histidine kinase n=1 Tax=Tenacibaculum retecalamus TaxID=3018315 RepID=UPI0023D9419B|nr:histidine kinase [Tenacibaculum retecalamus]WBX72301.1 histidine kinase [Tenacibaculum retecalamus]
MIQFFKKYKAFIFGFTVIIPIFYLLDYLGLIILPEDKTYQIFIFAFIWGLVIALPMHNYKYLKRNKKTALSVLVLFVLFFVALAIDTFMQLPDNPITFILLIGFWIGTAYLLAPSFFKKYWKLIAFFYVPIFLYFMYLRLFTGGLETYLEIKKEFPFTVFFIPIPILFSLWIFEQWKWLQNLKAEKSNTELSLLRAQINPHFFFNTLNNLYALTIKNSKQAPEVILKLSDMMRYTIYEGEKEKVELADEIEYLENYIQLHKIRYKKTVEITFTHTINTSLTISPLLYIILLENAFKHGVESLAENAFIHINLYEDKHAIYFELENNFDSKEKTQSSGIGLKNLKKRLSLVYKNNHELQVNNQNNIYKTTLKIAKHA